ncbi:hypothetical protein KR222_007425 [Zaprionus bogoriensis]|nr:hypothetical protein KR222_007425 [Zaprionus bogoriensis]
MAGSCLVVQSVGQRSCVQHRLDQRSRVHNGQHGSSVNHRGSMNHRGSVYDGSSMNHWSSVDSNGGSSVDGGLQDGSDDVLDDGLAVHLGDALVGDSRGCAVHHSADLGQDGLMHHMVGLDEASAGRGEEQSDDGNL